MLKWVRKSIISHPCGTFPKWAQLSTIGSKCLIHGFSIDGGRGKEVEYMSNTLDFQRAIWETGSHHVWHWALMKILDVWGLLRKKESPLVVTKSENLQYLKTGTRGRKMTSSEKWNIRHTLQLKRQKLKKKERLFKSSKRKTICFIHRNPHRLSAETLQAGME